VAIAVGVTSKGRSGTTASQATTGVTTQASGSTFIVAAIWDTTTFSSISDSKGNTYTQIGTEGNWGLAPGRARLYYCQNGIGGASHTATVALSGSTSLLVMFLEIIGGALTGILDQSGQARDTATPFTLTAGLTTTQPNELLVSFLGGTSGSNPATHAESGLGSSTVQAAAEETNGASFYTGALATAVKSAIGTYNPSWTEAGNTTDAQVFLATFRELTAGIGARKSTRTFPGRGPGKQRFVQSTRAYTTAVSGAIAGTDGLTFGQTGVLSGSGTLAATAALVFGQTGNLTGAGALVGSGALTFDQTGALTGSGALAASAALTFGQSGALIGSGALAGSSTLVFDATATLDQPSGAIAGTATLIFGQAAALTGSAVLAGTADMVFSQSGTLTQPNITPVEQFSGGFFVDYAHEQAVLRRKRREQDELEEEARELKDKVDREIALLLRAQEAETERKAELDRLQALVKAHSHAQLELSDRAKIAYVRALTQANFSAMEALDRELQRMIEEEEFAVLMLLLNDED
jgi:hypothetical protein